MSTEEPNLDGKEEVDEKQKGKKLSKVTIWLIVGLKIATIEARTHWNIILNIQKEVTINLKL